MNQLYEERCGLPPRNYTLHSVYHLSVYHIVQGYVYWKLYPSGNPRITSRWVFPLMRTPQKPQNVYILRILGAVGI